MILLVDHYDNSRCALAQLLRESGFEVVEACDGRAGLREARHRLPHLVIGDPWPLSSGVLQMVERLREAKEGPGVPLLVVTTVGSASLRSHVDLVGCGGFMEKPCTPGDLLTEVHRLLGESTFRRAASAATADLYHRRDARA